MDIAFTPVDDKNIGTLSEYFKYQRFRSTDYTTGGVYMWRDYFNARFAVADDMLVFLFEYLDMGEFFSYPVGKGDALSVVDKLRVSAGNAPLRFCFLTKPAVDELLSRYPDAEIQEYRDWADYLYDIDSFCGFPGKKLHGQRNHLNKFISLYPDYEFLPLTADNVGVATAFVEEYYNVKEQDLASVKFDSTLARLDAYATFEVLHKIDLLGTFFGGILRANGKTVGVTLGEIVGDTLYSHVEKALTDIPGTYQALSSEFAYKARDAGARYVNREDDAGDLGLRKSKLDYNPTEVIMKYTAVIN